MKSSGFLKTNQNKMIYLMILSFLFFVMPLQSQIMIETHDDHEYTGYVTEENEKELIIKTNSGIEAKVPRASIKNYTLKKSIITTKDGNKYRYHINKYDSAYVYYNQDYNVPGKLKRSDLLEFYIADASNEGYSSFGITMGTPAAINLLYSYQPLSLLNLRIQGGYIGTAYGIQANIGINLSKSNSFEQNLSICAGYSYLTPEKSYPKKTYKWTYTGICYNFNWGGFFTELGLAIGNGDYPNPQLMFQLGYVYRFLD